VARFLACFLLSLSALSFLVGSDHARGRGGGARWRYLFQILDTSLQLIVALGKLDKVENYLFTMGKNSFRFSS